MDRNAPMNLDFFGLLRGPPTKVLRASQWDRRLFRSMVVSIDKSRFDRRQVSVRSKTVTIA